LLFFNDRMTERFDYAQAKYKFHNFGCPTVSPISGPVIWASFKY